MKLSDEGSRLVKSFEGYHTRQADGSCVAYLCPAKVPTIGYGCTEGVKLGMAWSAEKAEEALRVEIAKFEAAVQQYVTVTLNQNQFDALVSFAYNVGAPALKRSTLLKLVNRVLFEKASREFPKWNRGGGRVLPGLVSRRAREAALFLKPTIAPAEPFMPQAVTPPASTAAKAAAVTATGGAGGLGLLSIPSLPPAPDLSPVLDWQGAAETATTAASWAVSKPVLVALIAFWVGAIVLLPKISERLGWAR